MSSSCLLETPAGKKFKTAIARIHIILRKMCPSTPLKLRNCQLTLKDKTAKTTHISYITDFSFLISRSKQLPKLRDRNPSKIHSVLNFKISHRFSCSVGTLHWCNQFLLLWFHQSPLTEIRYAWQYKFTYQRTTLLLLQVPLPPA